MHRRARGAAGSSAVGKRADCRRRRQSNGSWGCRHGTAITVTAAAAAANKPGFLHELGSWWNGSIAYFSAKLNDARGKFEDLGKTSKEAAKGAATATQEAVKNAVDVSKDAAGVVVRLPNTRLIEMRERCDKAPNGAPDCATAAAKGCRAKGFTGGTSLDVTTAENCPAPTLLSRQEPAKGECPVETVVTRAVCQ